MFGIDDALLGLLAGDIMASGAGIAAEGAIPAAAEAVGLGGLGTAAATGAASAAGTAGVKAMAEAAEEAASSGKKRKRVKGGSERGPGFFHGMGREALMWGLLMPAGQMALDRLVHGSEEDQMRRQMEMQDRFQSEIAARHGAGMGGEMGGMMAGGGESLNELATQDALMQDLSNAAYKLKRARSAQPHYLNPVLDNIIGNDARLAQMQAGRPLTIAEIMDAHGQMMGSDLNAY
jgi:hypothetical protein